MDRVAIMAALIVAWGPMDPHPESLALLYLDAADEHNLDPLLLLAVSYHESRLRTDRVSRVGACGIMQVIPRWSRWTCDEMQTHQGGIAAGVEALQYWGYSLAHYGGGNRPSPRYERVVKKYLSDARKIIDRKL